MIIDTNLDLTCPILNNKFLINFGFLNHLLMLIQLTINSHFDHVIEV